MVAVMLGVVLVLVSGALTWAEYRQTGELVTPWSLFLALAVYDVLAPACVMLAFGLGVQPDYIDPALNLVLPRAMGLFAVGAALFGITYYLVDSLPSFTPDIRRDYAADPPIREAVAVALYVLMFALQVAAFRGAVAEAGSLVEWGRIALTTRFKSDELTELSFVARLSSKVGMPILLAMTGVLFQLRGRRRLLFGVVLPLLTFALAVLTLLRGNVLNLMIGLAILANVPAQLPSAISLVASRVRRRAVGNRLLVAAIGIFLMLSVVRNVLTDWAWGVEGESSSLSAELIRLFRGDTLVGIASIMRTYGEELAFMGGKTITDMLLLPVPRAIYTSKPAWYGIDDITRAMGWPTSTQSAVGMPGELFANFGYAGIVGMIVYGASFALFRRLRRSAPGAVMYGFVLLPAMIATFWMGFTGFVSQLSTIPVLLVVFLLVYRADTGRRAGELSARTD